MIIVSLKGGLGNQMFQYAAARSLAEVNDKQLKLDLTFFEQTQRKANVTVRKYELNALNIIENIATPQEIRKRKNFKNKVLRKLFPNDQSNPYVKEKHFHFDPSLLTLTDDRYLDGYWMSEKYFTQIAAIIRKEFTFRNDILNEGKDLRSEIMSGNSVCIQVRRGDYITNPQIAKVHQTTSLDYFQHAITLMQTKVKNPVFYIFSDDCAWCQENFSGLTHKYFVEHELARHGAASCDYLQLMVSCKNFIISNSTFAWWAAWLATFEDKIVIAPQKWFNYKKIITKDIYPSDWIQI